MVPVRNDEKENFLTTIEQVCRAGFIPLLWGDTEQTRTMLAETLAKKHNLPLYIVSPPEQSKEGQEKLTTHSAELINTIKQHTNAVILLNGTVSTQGTEMQTQLISAIRKTFPNKPWIIASIHDQHNDEQPKANINQLFAPLQVLC